MPSVYEPRRASKLSRREEYAAYEQAYWTWRAALATANPSELPLAEQELFTLLRRYARRILYSRFDADEREVVYDLADRAVGIAFTAGASYSGTGKFTSWFYRVTRNLAREWLRDNRRRPKRGLSKYNLKSLEALLAVGSELAATPEALDARIAVAQLRKLLSSAEDIALFDCKLEGMSNEEICQKFDWPYGSHTANSADNRWRVLLRRLRAHLGVGGGDA